MTKFLHIIKGLLVGDRVVIPKSGVRIIQHHGIYLGFSNSYHWFIENKDGIGVRVVKAEVFFSDVYEITRIVRFTPKSGYSRHDLYRYAMTKKGKPYHLVNYNCEHLANELQYRVVRSKQADTGVGFALFGLALLLLGGLSGGKNK